MRFSTRSPVRWRVETVWSCAGSARMGRNPRTGAQVKVSEKVVPYFKTGKEMRERLNKSRR
jgi:hypothetical protein